MEEIYTWGKNAEDIKGIYKIFGIAVLHLKNKALQLINAKITYKTNSTFNNQSLSKLGSNLNPWFSAIILEVIDLENGNNDNINSLGINETRFVFLPIPNIPNYIKAF